MRQPKPKKREPDLFGGGACPGGGRTIALTCKRPGYPTEACAEARRGASSKDLVAHTDDVIRIAHEVGVDPIWLLALMMQETALLYDTGLLLSQAGWWWQIKDAAENEIVRHDPGGPSIGIVNITKQAFGEVQAQFEDDLSGRKWEELAVYDLLSIKVLAFG